MSQHIVTTLTLPILLTALLLGASCDREYAASATAFGTPDDGNNEDPGASNAGNNSDDDNDGAALITEPIVVTTGSIQRFGHLVWAGDRYAVDWIENIGGRLFMMLAYVDPWSGVVTGPVEVSVDLGWDPDAPDLSPQSTFIHWDAEANAIHAFWTTEISILERRFGLDGEPLGPERTVVADAGPHAYIAGVVTRRGGLSVLWRDDGEREFNYKLYLAQIVPRAATLERILLVEGDTSVDVGGVVVQPACDCIEVAWKPGSPPLERAQVLLSRFDELGRRTMDDRVVLSGDTLHMTFTGSALVPGVVGVWDYDLGAFLQWVPLDPERPAPTVLLPMGGGRPALALSPDGATLGVLSDSDGDTPLFYTSDARTGLLAPAIEIPGSEPNISAATIAAGAGGFGVLMDRPSDVVFVQMPP